MIWQKKDLPAWNWELSENHDHITTEGMWEGRGQRPVWCLGVKVTDRQRRPLSKSFVLRDAIVSHVMYTTAFCKNSKKSTYTKFKAIRNVLSKYGQWFCSSFQDRANLYGCIGADFWHCSKSHQNEQGLVAHCGTVMWEPAGF